MFTYTLLLCSRGIAMMVESDFYRTEEGRKYFLDQIKVSDAPKNT